MSHMSHQKKQEQDKNKLFTYNKILTRIHEKIKLTSRQKCQQQFCWFVVPEIILGVANYDHAGCIAYIVDKLQERYLSIAIPLPELVNYRLQDQLLTQGVSYFHYSLESNDFSHDANFYFDLLICSYGIRIF